MTSTDTESGGCKVTALTNGYLIRFTNGTEYVANSVEQLRDVLKDRLRMTGILEKIDRGLSGE